MQYIDKDALVTEIRKRLLPVIRDKQYDEWEEGQDSERIAILDIINTLEVKEVYSEIEQRMKECPYRQVGCTMYEDKILECTGACGWVVDYLNLKKLKARKGE